MTKRSLDPSPRQLVSSIHTPGSVVRRLRSSDAAEELQPSSKVAAVQRFAKPMQTKIPGLGGHCCVEGCASWWTQNVCRAQSEAPLRDTHSKPQLQQVKRKCTHCVIMSVCHSDCGTHIRPDVIPRFPAIPGIAAGESPSGSLWRSCGGICAKVQVVDNLLCKANFEARKEGKFTSPLAAN